MISRFPPHSVFIGLWLLLLIAIGSGLSIGAVTIPWDEIPTLISAKLGWSDDAPASAVVFWQLRLPRVILALAVGASLSVAGAMMQGLFRNPLADPGLVGISSGAALGAVFMIVVGERIEMLAFLRGPYLIPAAALLGAWLITWLVLRLGSSPGGGSSVATLLLAGIAINAFVGAIIGLCTFLATDAQLRSLNFWMLGSLGGASWSHLILVLPFCLILLCGAPSTARALNAISLGESESGHLGFRPDSVRRWVILLTSIGVGGCVAQTGMIGFVGLVVPHLLRLMIGPNHVHLLPGSALLGSALLLLADTFSRILVAPAEMPIGIVTAAVGAPFFLFLLSRQKMGASLS